MAATPDFLSPEHSQPPSLLRTPGPLSLSQLDTSHAATRGGKLEPLQLAKERRPKRKTKAQARHLQDNAESSTVDRENVPEHEPVSCEVVSPQNEDSLVSIRARLDPFYQSHAAPSLEPELDPPIAAETVSEPAAEPKKKKKRRRKKETEEEAPLQEGGTGVATDPVMDVDPPAPGHTAPMLRDDPQADGESSPTVSEGIVVGSQVGSEPNPSTKPKRRKKREPRSTQQDPEEVERQLAPPPMLSSPSPPLPPQDVHAGMSTIPVRFEPPPEMELRQGGVLSYTPTSEHSLGESYGRLQTESPLVSGSRTPQVFQGSLYSTVEDTPHEQETASRWPVPPEDIIERASVQEPISATAALFISRDGAGEQNALEGQSRDVVYLERRDGKGFIAQKRTESVGTSRETGLEAASTYRNVINSALVAQGTHAAIQRICLALLGLLAGLSLLDVVMVYVLSHQEFGQAGLLQYYSPVSLPLLSVYVILFLLVFVSVLDRLDPSHWSKECLGLYCQSPKQLLVTAAVALLFLAMVVTFSIAFIYERISLYPQYPNLWLDLLDEFNTTVTAPSLVTHTVGNTVYAFSGRSSVLVTAWQALAVIRAVCCVSVWLVIACLNDYDRLGDYLREKEEEGRKCTQ